MHYEKAPRFRRSKLDVAPPPLAALCRGFAGFSRANFTFRVALENGVPYAAANYFLVIAPSMIAQTVHSLSLLLQDRHYTHPPGCECVSPD
jgi:hypothetical protein